MKNPTQATQHKKATFFEKSFWITTFLATFFFSTTLILTIVVGVLIIPGYSSESEGINSIPILRDLNELDQRISNKATRASVLETISNDFLGEIPSAEVLDEGAIKGIVGSLQDPYSEYLTEEETRQFRDSLNENYEGIGIRFLLRDEKFVITQIIPNSPAADAGLKAEDIITEVDDKSVANYTTDDIVNAIRGPENTTVTITVLRGNEFISKEIPRRSIEIDLVQLTKEGTVGIISISSFGDNVDAELNEVVRNIKQDPEITAIVLDLRSNTGGILNQAVEAASYFLPPDSIVTVEQGKETRVVDYSTSKSDNLQNYPLVVVVDEFTASASEILAAALRDNRNVPIVGGQTFGKGVVQKLYSMPNGGTLKLTIAEWLTPKGDKIHEVGLVPDIEATYEDSLKLAIEEAKKLT